MIYKGFRDRERGSKVGRERCRREDHLPFNFVLIGLPSFCRLPSLFLYHFPSYPCPVWED